jgi:nucleotide-binding universal stress UspA family protein
VSAAEQPILLCYDGSDDARDAIEQAGKLLSGRAIVVTVWQRFVYAMAGYGAASMAAPGDTSEIDLKFEEASKRTAAEGLERALAAGFDAESETIAAKGPVWDALLKFSDERDAAVIVLGSRGLSGFKSFMLGSVSHGVAHRARRPVLIVPPPDPPGA